MRSTFKYSYINTTYTILYDSTKFIGSQPSIIKFLITCCTHVSSRLRKDNAFVRCSIGNHLEFRFGCDFPYDQERWITINSGLKWGYKLVILYSRPRIVYYVVSYNNSILWWTRTDTKKYGETWRLQRQLLALYRKHCPERKKKLTSNQGRCERVE